MRCEPAVTQRLRCELRSAWGKWLWTANLMVNPNFFIAGLDRLQYPSIKCSNYLFEPFVFWLLNLTDPTMRSAFICIPQLLKKNDWKKTHFFDTKFCSVFYKCIFFKPILISVFLCLHVSEVKVKHCQKFCSQHCCQWKQHIVIQYEILQSVNF